MKHWNNFCETYAYPFSSYGECPGAYPGFDPYGYGYYGYKYYRNAAAAAAAAGHGAFPNMEPNQFRSRPGGSGVGTNNVRSSIGAQVDHHALATGLDFSAAHPPQTAPGMVAGAAAGFPHQ
ncbi:unnamed protein product [Echinostoma caproni]|uniref:Uncharacterized protein n=1 Tax=Echinostoma caproni TaxID=27848 RepID=A0A183ASH3_9TREM|nr:unnamed protein product [Echinostoma caproni]